MLAALDPSAAALGLIPGQALAAARAQVPDLVQAVRQRSSETRRLGQIEAWCQRYTPLVALDPLGDGGDGGSLAYGGGAGLYLDITGCAHLFGGETVLLNDLLGRLARLGHSARAGLADSPGAAWALARYATSDAAPARRLVAEQSEPGATAAALDPLPPAALRLSAAASQLLERLGVSRIADLRRLPAASLSARVGSETLLRLRQALGSVEEPISPQQPQELPAVRQAFAEPLLTPEAVAAVLERLLVALTVELERRGLGARRLEAVGHRADGSQVRLAIGTSRPSRDPRHLSRLAAPQRDLLDPGYGLEVLSLTATRSEPLGPEQVSLPAGDRFSSRPHQSPQEALQADAQAACNRPQGAAPQPADLAGLVDRLQSRLGAGSVARPRARARHRPELAVAYASPLALEQSQEESWPEEQPPRPLLLLTKPERIAVLALLPDHPPRRLDWRGERLEVIAAEGPERIEPAWWDPREAETPARDYYRLQVADGRRFWVFRAGADWFLQGVYA